MRNILLVTWLLLPIGAWAYHEGPGQDRQKLEQMDATIVAAHADAAAGRWRDAVRGYEEALKQLPKDADAIDPRVQQRLQIELAKARMQSSGLGDARMELETLVDQLSGEPKSDPAVLRDARQALARAQFFTTWLMRLEGLPRETWEPEIEAARQNWRWLAEQPGDAKQALAHQGDLEAAIRLERMQIEDLQGLPLPGE
jgi:uncharacterized membrane protein YccC